MHLEVEAAESVNMAEALRNIAWQIEAGDTNGEDDGITWDLEMS